jgi:hypothetical protein
VSGLFTSAWIAEAPTLGEHLCLNISLKVSARKMGDRHSRPFLLAINSSDAIDECISRHAMHMSSIAPQKCISQINRTQNVIQKIFPQVR